MDSDLDERPHSAMSVAARFKYHRPFPFCPPAFSATGGYDYVGGLTLSQAMDFYWNTEDIEFTFAGSSNDGTNTANASGTIKFDPPTVTGNFINGNQFFIGRINCGMLFISDGDLTDIGDQPPATREPRERVCAGSNRFLEITVAQGDFSDTYKITRFVFESGIVIDPIDSTKFGMMYRFILLCGDFHHACVNFCNPAYGVASSRSSSGSYTTGTFSIDGYSFDWRCYYNGSVSGASMSATTTKFTYP